MPDAREWIGKLARNLDLRTVATIDSQSGGFGKWFPALLKSPHLANLTRITIFEDIIGVAGVSAIAESPSAFALEHLDLNTALAWEDEEQESDEAFAAVKVLATHPRFASLKYLGLSFNSLGDKSIATFLESKTLAGDLNLNLLANNYDRQKYNQQLVRRFSHSPLNLGDENSDSKTPATGEHAENNNLGCVGANPHDPCPIECGRSYLVSSNESKNLVPWLVAKSFGPPTTST